MAETAPYRPAELWQVFLAFVLIAILALGIDPFRGQIPGPFDLLVSQPGWGNRITSGEVRFPDRSDVLDYYLPRWTEARHQIREGYIPLWNRLPAGGEPGILNLSTGELTPAFALFALAPTAPTGLLLAVLFNLAFGATGAYALVRRFGARLPAVFAGLTLMLSGFTAAWLYWPHVSTAIWICWLLWGIERAATPGVRFVVAGVALPLVGLLVGGFPFVSLLGLGAAALYLGCALLVDRARFKRDYVVHLAAGLLVALGLSLPGLVGFAEWLKDFDLSQRVTGSLLTYRDIELLLPDAARHAATVETGMFAGTIPVLLTFEVMLLWPLAYVMRRARMSLLMVFALALLSCSAILVFSLVPQVWLEWIPGLANNRWSRAICILDLAVALVAGAALQDMIIGPTKRWLPCVMVFAIVLQGVDLASYFRMFNGPVSRQAYYPSVPSIMHMATGIRPFQSALADNAFLVSGTLGAYGVPEWFGHGFKSDALKSLLGRIATDSMTSATASAVNADAIHLESPIFSALAIRYVVGGDTLASSLVGVPTEAKKAGRAPAIPMPGNTLAQRMRLFKSTVVEGISFNLANYGRPGQAGTLYVALRRVGDDTDIATWSVPAAEILNNRMRLFPLPSRRELAAGDYMATLEYKDASPGDLLTVWTFPGKWNGCDAMANGRLVGSCLDAGFSVKRSDLGHFVKMRQDRGIYLLENTTAPAGPYFIRSLVPYRDAPASDRVTLMNYGSHGFSVRYTGEQPGFLVVPMSWRSGWRALDHGKQVHPSMYLDVLPAFAVKESSKLVFQYRPRALTVGMPIAFGTLLAWFGIFAIRRRRRPHPASLTMSVSDV